ncbi:MAG: zinc-ribbon domain-containing protein [Candidatus Dormibacteria bacterium]
MEVQRRATAWAAQGTALVVLGVLYFVDLFLPWSQQCNFRGVLPTPFQPGGFGVNPTAATVCFSQTDGWGGAGTVAGVLVALLVVWEAAQVARLTLGLGAGHRSLISSGLSFGVLLFTIVNVAAALTWMHPAIGSLLYGGTFLWISLALGVAIGVAGWLHWRIWQENPPLLGGAVAVPPEVPPPPPRGTCPSCGRLNSEDARFCSACGASLAASPGKRGAGRTGPGA